MSFDGPRGLALMVRRSLRRHLLSTLVTATSMALGCGLVMSVMVVNSAAYEAFTGGNIGFDAVLGARGSKLQLVLNTIFHLETSPGNIPWQLYKEIEADPRIALAVPYAVGDNYRGFRIVGTTPELFTRFEYQEGRRYTPRAPGRVFDPQYREAVVGAFVAQQAGLRPGAKFNPYHGVVFDENAKHQEEYVVVGVLEPTNSPADRVIWIPIEGIYRMGGHVLRGTGEVFKAEAGAEIPVEHREVSAVMLKLKSRQSGFSLSQMINGQGKVATLAWPIDQVMAELFDKLGWVNRVLGMVAWMVVVVAGFSMLAALYNTMSARRREMAILRALGARRRTLFAAIVLESTAIALLGALLGFVIYAVVMSIAAELIRGRTGVVINVFSGHWILPATPPAAMLVGAFAGVLPAIKAYRTDVAASLAPVS